MLGNTTDSDGGSMASLVTRLPPASARLSQSLPPRGIEPELQMHLTEEHKRTEQHRQNYERLKAQHSRLLEENTKLQNECRQKGEENKLLFNQFKSTQEQFKNQLLVQDEEIGALRTRVVTPQQLELIRLETYSELEKVFKVRYQKLEIELEEFKNCCNRQRYELSLLETKCEQQAVQHRTVFQELRKKLETEVNNVRAEKERSIAQTQAESLKDSEQIFALKRNSVTLQEQLRVALTGLEEVQAHREKSNLEVDRLGRLLTKNETEYSANLKSLEAKNESQLKEIQKFQEELYECEGMQMKISNQKHEFEQENINLRQRVEQLVRVHKMEISELKMEMTKKVGETERERDRLANTVEDFKVQLDVAEQTSKQQAQNLLEKKREVARQIQVVKEKEMQKQNQIECEKLDLEARLQEIQRKKLDDENIWQTEKDGLEDKLKEAVDSRILIEKEVLVLRTRQDQERSVKEELEQEKSDNSSLRSQVGSLQTEINNLHMGEHDVNNKCMRLRNSIDKYRGEVKRLQEQVTNTDCQNAEMMNKQKAMWKENLERLENRNQELEGKCEKNFSRMSMAANIHCKYKKRSLHAIRTLKKQLELKTAKNEELETSCDIFKNWISPAEHKKLKHQLRDMLRRHNEFRRLIFTNSPLGGIDTSLHPHANGTFSSDFDDQEECHKRELSQLKQRLDRLDCVQREHLEELQNIISSTPHNRSTRLCEGNSDIE